MRIDIATLLFNRQIIIDFLPVTIQGNAEGLKRKWELNHEKADTCIIIPGKDFFKKKIDTSSFNSKDILRIYIIGHGKPGDEFITDDEDKKIYFHELAIGLLPFIKNLMCVVNLVVCYGGSDKEIENYNIANSFAANLHEFLFIKANRDIPVVARVSRLLIDLGEPDMNDHFIVPILALFKNRYPTKKTIPFHEREYDQGFCYSKQPGSKIIFTMDSNGNQVKLDAYYHTWRKKVIKTLTAIKSEAPHKKIQDLLQSWLNIIDRMTPEEIFSLMNSEVNNSRSILKENSPLIDRLFSSSVINRIKALVDEGKQMLEDPFTFSSPVITRENIKKTPD